MRNVSLGFVVFLVGHHALASRPDVAPAVITGMSNAGPSITGGSSVCPPTDIGVKLGKAGSLAMAALYGSCEAGKIVEGGAPSGPSQCSETLQKAGDMNSTFKPACANGPMPKYSQDQPRMTNQGDVCDFPGNKTDCSGLVSGILCRAGAKVSPKDSSFKAHATSEMINWGNGGDCFTKVQGNLKVGDVLVGRTSGKGHTVIICDCLGCGDEGSGDPSKLIVCESTSSPKDLIRRTLKETSFGGSNNARIVYEKGNGMAVRHAGDKKAGCVEQKKLKFKNEDCVQSCPDIKPQGV